MEVYSVTGFQHFKELMESARKKYGLPGRTNIYYIGDALEKWVNGGLEYYCVNGGVCFIKEENGQKKLYYALNTEAQSIPVPLHNIITEVICRDERKKEEEDLFLKKSGFELTTIYYEMIKRNSTEESYAGAPPVPRAEVDDAGKLLDFWKRNLNTSEHPLPGLDKLRGMILNGQVIALKKNDSGGDSGILAAMVTRVDRKIGYIEYVAVDKDFRNRGMGKMLMGYIDKIPSVKKWFLFVSEGNHAARKLYEKCGFAYSGRQLFQYCKI